MTIVAAASLLAATPAAADTRYLSYDAADTLTRALTRGVTLEVERGLFGRVSARRLFSTSARGSAGLDKKASAAARGVLPAGDRQTETYRIDPEGDGRALGRALCPGSDETWLVMDRPRAARPLVMNAVGRWSDGGWRHCARLVYDYRGEWAQPPRPGPGEGGTPVGR